MMDTVRQLQDKLTTMQTALDEVTANLAMQQRQLLAASTALNTLIVQLGALPLGSAAVPVPPMATSHSPQPGWPGE
jgi:hypothetical protein